MGRDKYPRQSLGVLHNQIKQSRVLLVGAGGIGCELLKNLVLTGFGEIHVVDLDTIDLSNLNRQFLFRQEHIKKSKALVAKESAQKFNPNVKIEAHHSNIKDQQFNTTWFGSFNVVFNALDNLDARRHVNRMCLAADVPLIESGTTGFNGQVQVIRRGETECYDCNPKETPKSFPVCTIRSTPSQPIHCIVWAKSYLFTEIFGISEDEAPELDHSEDSDNVEEIENLRKEANALKIIRQSMGSDEFPQKVFEKVFKEDIERLRSMEDMWKTRKPPDALSFELLVEESKDIDGSTTSTNDQKVWTTAEDFAVFVDSLQRLSKRLKEAQSKESGGSAPSILAFDKDDVDTLDFVAASANLRSKIFGIETRSKFDIKQMAGNIIPAIATTNAMTAGLCVLQAFKVLRGSLEKARMVFLVKSTERVISAEKLAPPNPNCGICGVAQSKVEIDPSRATLSDLVDDMLKLQLGYGEDFSISNEVGTIYDPELDDNLPKKLSELGIKGDSFLTVIDEEEENPRINLVLSVAEKSFPLDVKPISFPEVPTVARKSKAAPSSSTNGHVHEPAQTVGQRRKRSLDDVGREEENLKKRGIVPEETNGIDDGVVLVDDSTDGAILIDDD